MKVSGGEALYVLKLSIFEIVQAYKIFLLLNIKINKLFYTKSEILVKICIKINKLYINMRCVLIK